MAGNAAGALKNRAAAAGVSVELLEEHERRGEHWCFRSSPKSGGKLLDGIEWCEFPEIAHAAV